MSSKPKPFKSPLRSHKIEKNFENELEYLKEELASREVKFVQLKNEYDNSLHLDYEEKDAKLLELTEKWRQAAQELVQDLHSKMNEPKPLMIDMLNHLQIDPKTLRYNEEEDSFD